MSLFGASTEAAQEIIYMGGHNVPPLVQNRVKRSNFEEIFEIGSFKPLQLQALKFQASFYLKRYGELFLFHFMAISFRLSLYLRSKRSRVNFSQKEFFLSSLLICSKRFYVCKNEDQKRYVNLQQNALNFDLYAGYSMKTKSTCITSFIYLVFLS